MPYRTPDGPPPPAKEPLWLRCFDFLDNVGCVLVPIGIILSAMFFLFGSCAESCLEREKGCARACEHKEGGGMLQQEGELCTCTDLTTMKWDPGAAFQLQDAGSPQERQGAERAPQ